LSPRLTTVAWLIRDTFRQSMAHGIFAVLLIVSLLSIEVCSTLSVTGRDTFAIGDDNPDFVSRRDQDATDQAKLESSGVLVADGKLTLAFGAISVPLA